MDLGRKKSQGFAVYVCGDIKTKRKAPKFTKSYRTPKKAEID